METLDNILSGKGEAAPAPEAKPETETVATAAETPTEQATEQETETGQTMVPHAALHAEKQKVKRYTEQVASFEQKLSESNAAWERRMAQLLERVTPPQQPQAEPDWFDKPRDATLHTVAPHLQQMQNFIYANARIVAETSAGEDKVKEAQAAFDAAMQSRTLDPSDYQKVMSSPNPFMEAVRWHKREQTKAEIGDDVVAYREKLKAELLAELQQGNVAQPQSAPVMPSNLAGARNVGSRSGPAWNGPPTLNDIFNRSKPAG